MELKITFNAIFRYSDDSNQHGLTPHAQKRDRSITASDVMDNRHFDLPSYISQTAARLVGEKLFKWRDADADAYRHWHPYAVTCYIDIGKTTRIFFGELDSDAKCAILNYADKLAAEQLTFENGEN